MTAPDPKDARPLPLAETARRARVVAERIRTGNLEPFTFDALPGIESPARRAA